MKNLLSIDLCGIKNQSKVCLLIGKLVIPDKRNTITG